MFESSYDYVVKTFKFLDYGIKELKEKKLAMLLPFYVLKLRLDAITDRHKKKDVFLIQSLWCRKSLPL